MICFKRTCLFTVHSGIEPSEKQYAFYTYEYRYNAFKDMVWSYDPYQDKEITYSYEYALK